MPDWIGNFQNPAFPELFGAYAGAFARRYPWLQLYTPVNEMFICATFSAAYGWWNEQPKDDRSFVTALKHIVKANVLAMQAILEARPDAIFIQSESSEYFHADTPKAISPAEIANARRFLSLDLNYGRRVESEMYEFLMDNGMTRDEYHFFLGNKLKRHCIMGNDYYVTNEHRVAPDGSTRAAGEVFGYDSITRQYHERYHLPVMHTETNLRQGHLAMRQCTGYGRNGPTCCICAMTGFRLWALPGTHSRIRWTGTRRCANLTATWTRSDCTIWIANFVRLEKLTDNSLWNGAKYCRRRASA